MTAVLSARDLGKAFGSKWALRNCTLDLPTGAVVGLVGPNGAGKSTFLELAVGLLAPTHGELRLWGALLGERQELLADLGFVAQDAPLYPAFRVRDMLMLGHRMNPVWDGAWARERLRGLDIPLNRRDGSLSGWQR